MNKNPNIGKSKVPPLKGFHLLCLKLNSTQHFTPTDSETQCREWPAGWGKSRYMAIFL